MQHVALTICDSQRCDVYVGALDTPATPLQKLGDDSACLDSGLIYRVGGSIQVLARRRACEPEFGKTAGDFGSELVLYAAPGDDPTAPLIVQAFSQAMQPIGIVGTSGGVLVALAVSDDYRRVGTGTDLAPPLTPTGWHLSVYEMGGERGDLTPLYTTPYPFVPPVIAGENGVAYRVDDRGDGATSFVIFAGDRIPKMFTTLPAAVEKIYHGAAHRYADRLSESTFSSRSTQSKAPGYSVTRAAQLDDDVRDIVLPFRPSMQTAFAPGTNQSILFEVEQESRPAQRRLRYVIVDHATGDVSDIRQVAY